MTQWGVSIVASSSFQDTWLDRVLDSLFEVYLHALPVSELVSSGLSCPPQKHVNRLVGYWLE